MHGPDEEDDFQQEISITPRLPPPPSPSADPGVAVHSGASSSDPGIVPEPETLDVFTLTPVAALKILCESIEVLVRTTGDVPPTPPISKPTTPKLGVVDGEKENAARLDSQNFDQTSLHGAGDVDGVPPQAKTPIGSPEAHPMEPIHVVGADAEPLKFQHGAIARKFYSKKPPPITVEKYLERLHHYCPASTAVYLATSLYIHRIAAEERIIPVTARNVHRLVLAGLRIAMKALEDQSYPHRRFAKVGGVSESELGRLEVSFCFITNFELKVDKEMLLRHAKIIKDSTTMYNIPDKIESPLPAPHDPGSLKVGQRHAPLTAAQETLATA